MSIDIQKLKELAEAAKSGGADWSDLDINTERMYPAEGSLVCLYEVATPAVLLELIAEIERLQRLETAYSEFSDKTDWVRPNAAAHELGMHVADVLRKRCDDLTSHNQAQADEIVRLRKDQVEAISDYNAAVDRKDKFIGECDHLKTENAALRKFIIGLAQDDAQIAYAYAAICGEQQL